MKFLLDTHVWIWSILEPQRLAQPIRERMEDGRAELWLSPISIWETMILARRGRIDIGDDPRGWIDFALHEFPVGDAVLTRAIAFESRVIQLDHEDPADRFLAATARVNGLVLLTHDRALIESQLVPTIGP